MAKKSAPLDLCHISPALKRSAHGIWFAGHTSAVSYPDQGNQVCFGLEDDSFWYGHRDRVLVDVIKRHRPSGPILDIGGGNGVVSAALLKAGFEVVLLNPDPQGVANARARGIDHLICAAFDDCAFQSDSVPAVGLFDVMEHIEDDAAFVSQIHRILKPQGHLYLSVPAYDFLWSHHDERAGHYRRYALGELKTRLRRANFRIKYATYLFALLPLPILLLRTLPHRLHRAAPVSAVTLKSEHQPRRALTRHMLALTLGAELAMVNRGWAVPFGTSCLVVADKV